MSQTFRSVIWFISTFPLQLRIVHYDIDQVVTRYNQTLHSLKEVVKDPDLLAKDAPFNGFHEGETTNIDNLHYLQSLQPDLLNIERPHNTKS